MNSSRLLKYGNSVFYNRDVFEYRGIGNRTQFCKFRLIDFAALVLRIVFEKILGILSSEVAGLPMGTPLALAFCKPLLTRWLMMLRSSSLNTPIIFSIPSVMGSSSFVQSTINEPNTNLMCLSFANSMISQSCFVLRVIRLTSVATIVSPAPTAFNMPDEYPAMGRNCCFLQQSQITVCSLYCNQYSRR